MLALVSPEHPVAAGMHEKANRFDVEVLTMTRARDQRLEYSPPTLQRLGTLVELTEKGSGTAEDIADQHKEGGSKSLS
jgi:hypothetical protein